MSSTSPSPSRTITVGSASMEVAYVPMPNNPKLGFQYFNLHDDDKTEVVTEAARLLNDAVPAGQVLYTTETATYEIAYELRRSYKRTVHCLAKKPRCDLPSDRVLKQEYGAVTSATPNYLYAARPPGAVDGAPPPPMTKVAFFDNVTTSGGTIIASARLLRRMNIVIECAYVLFTEDQPVTELRVDDGYTIPVVAMCGHLPLVSLVAGNGHQASEEDSAVSSSEPVPAAAAATGSTVVLGGGQYQLRSESDLPTTDYGTLKFCVFAAADGCAPAVVVFANRGQGVDTVRPFRVRVHDACLTSEVFHSAKCDCRDQLHNALRLITENSVSAASSSEDSDGAGCVIYLMGNEGRGVGLADKIRAYALQTTQGLDTVDANRALGLPDDDRKYEAARDILRHFGIDDVNLITSNPRKVARLASLGVRVSATTSAAVPPNSDLCRQYVATKVARMGHTPLDDADDTSANVKSRSGDDTSHPRRQLMPPGHGWAVVRIHGRPLGDASTTTAFPTVHAAGGFRFFLGRSKTSGFGEYRTTIDADWFRNVHDTSVSPVHGLTYVIYSADELCLFLVGPADVTEGGTAADVNVTGEWPGREVTVVGPGHSILHEPSSGKLQPGSSKFAVFVPTQDTRQMPINYKGPFGAMEVQTRLFNPAGNVFMRLEQFDFDRIPLPDYTVWREASRDAYSRYLRQSSQDDARRTLNRCSTMAFTWCFAIRHVFEDSGWAAAFAAQDDARYKNHLAVLGFETNNPIHDDHDGRGPHFHMGLKSGLKHRERNPAFYIDPDNGSVSQRVYNTLDVELSASSLFGVFRVGGRLALGPLVRLRNRRTGMYLYVRESERGEGQGVFQTSDGNMGDNVLWMLISMPSSVSSDESLPRYRLCNLRSTQLAGIDGSDVPDHLAQSPDFESPATSWAVAPSTTGNGTWTLRNDASGHYMYGFFDHQALPIAQFGVADDGAEWGMEAMQAGNFVDKKAGIVDTSDRWQWRRITNSGALSPTYTLAATSFGEAEASVRAYKNGSPWVDTRVKRTLASDRDVTSDAVAVHSRVGVVQGRVTACSSTDVPVCFEQTITYNMLTGKAQPA